MRPQRPLLLITLTLTLAACLAAPTPTATPISSLPSPTPSVTPTIEIVAATATPAPSPTPPAPKIAERVLIISIDGLRPDAISDEVSPNIMALARRGAYSWAAQTVLPPVTLPAHASMLSGVGPERHGLTWNDYEPERGTISVATIFSVAHAAGYRTVMVIGKEKLLHIAAPGRVDEVVDLSGSGDFEISTVAAGMLATGVGVMFVHLPGVDRAGHTYSWMSPEYLSAVASADEAVGRLMAFLDAPGLTASTLVILTADHGGLGYLHGRDISADRTIPWIVAGPGVPAGHELTTGITVMDTAATALYALGLVVPEDWEGKPVVEAFGWEQRASMPTARSEMPAAVLDGLIYVPGGFGGESTFEVYDPASDTWRALADLPDGRHHLMATAHAGRVFVFGGARVSGWEPTNTAWTYDPATDSWDVLTPMPEARLAGAAVSVGDFVYVVGCAGGTGALLRYDPAADAWATLAALDQPREHTAAVALDGRIYALAGRWGGVGELTSVEVSEPAADTWTPAAQMNVARGGLGAAVLAGQIVVVGGEVIVTGNATLDSVEVFNPAEGTWAFAPALPVPLHGVPAVSVGDALYVVGGSDRAGAVENRGRVLRYRPE